MWSSAHSRADASLGRSGHPLRGCGRRGKSRAQLAPHQEARSRRGCPAACHLAAFQRVHGVAARSRAAARAVCSHAGEQQCRRRRWPQHEHCRLQGSHWAARRGAPAHQHAPSARPSASRDGSLRTRAPRAECGQPSWDRAHGRVSPAAEPARFPKRQPAAQRGVCPVRPGRQQGQRRGHRARGWCLRTRGGRARTAGVERLRGEDDEEASGEGGAGAFRSRADCSAASF
mmetsp:Transcript_14794/g.37092  ORF Transcript_14794/g.37092 Transcript_14794/m.37092 type:complete len:230 (+) Transcript_14794:135-824(+)